MIEAPFCCSYLRCSTSLLENGIGQRRRFLISFYSFRFKIRHGESLASIASLKKSKMT